MAATPRTVVYRNDVMELLQYMPQTDEVHATPLLAVQHRRTVFTISYRNPDSSLSGVTMEDYLVFGTQAALDVVTGSPAPTPSTSSLSVWAERSPR